MREASTDSEWVARCVEGVGHEVIVADPNVAPMYATRTRKVKTDRRDARALADACLLGAYRPAHRLSDPQRHVRGRLTVRDAVVRTRTRSISLIRALLRQQGYRVPSGGAEACVQRVAAVTLPGRLCSTIAPLLAIMRHLNAQLAYSDRAIEHLAAHDARVQRLRTVPSIGPVTATAVVATLDDVQRVRHAHQVEAYLGLVPRERSSGETQRRGHITKTGHARVRWLLIHAAVSIRRRRPPQAEALHAWALPIAACRGKHVAVVIRKFFLHVSKKEQKKRFLERLENPEKNWKFSPNDLKERAFWDDYMQAYEDMIRHTATKAAPWYVVPADNKWFTRLVVAAAAVGTLDSLNLRYPKVGAEKLKEFAAAKRALLAGE